MLALTKKTEYALIALAYLADRRERFSSARQIAQAYSLPLPVLMNILKALNHEGLVESTRGARGGYKLAAEPEAVSLTRLIEAIEGPVKLIQCADHDHDQAAEGRGYVCERMGKCPIRGPVLQVHERLNNFLSDLTLADVVAHKKSAVQLGRPSENDQPAAAGE